MIIDEVYKTSIGKDFGTNGKNIISESTIHDNVEMHDSKVYSSSIENNCMISHCTLNRCMVMPNVMVLKRNFTDKIIYASWAENINDPETVYYLYYDRVKKDMFIDINCSMNNLSRRYIPVSFKLITMMQENIEKAKEKESMWKVYKDYYLFERKV